MEQQLQHDIAGMGAPEAAAPAPGPEVLAWPLASPWRRWFARLFDLWCGIMVVGFTGGLVLGQVAPAVLGWLDTPGSGKLVGLLCLPFALLLDAGVMAAFGNTPGKALLGLRLRQTDGQPLTLRQLCWRNLGVWSAGLGLGLPLINLLTMARQHRRLKGGEQASYDEEGFRVWARPIGWGRRLGFVAVFLLLFALMTGLEHSEREDARRLAARLAGPSFQWTNPGTGRSISVVPQWSYAQTQADDGVVLHQFTQHSDHAVVILSAEDADGMSLAEYARSWNAGVADTFKVPAGSFGQFRGMPSWTAVGSHRKDAMRVQVRLVLVDGQFWRIIAVQSSPVAYTDDLVDALGARLWDTVLPRQ